MNPGLRRLHRGIPFSSISDDLWAIEMMDIDGDCKNSETVFNISKCNPTHSIGMRNFLSKRKDRLNRRDWNDHGNDWEPSDND
jgi:hypothetical protein